VENYVHVAAKNFHAEQLASLRFFMLLYV